MLNINKQAENGKLVIAPSPLIVSRPFSSSVHVKLVPHVPLATI